MATGDHDLLSRLAEDGIERVELKLSDLTGQWHAISLEARRFEQETFQRGIPIDATTITNWPALLPRELTVLPDPATAWIDPFVSPRTLSLIGSFQAAAGRTAGPGHCARSLAGRALAHLGACGLADGALFGAEPEFFLFEQLLCQSDANGSSCRLVPGQGTPQALLDELLLSLAALGLQAHGPARPSTAHRQRLTLGGADPLRAADALMVTRYVVRQVARRHGRTATFLPRPSADGVSAGMAVHQSLWKNGHPLFHGEGTYAGLSQSARWYVGGLLRHGPSLAAFTNPGTNSYRRLNSGPDAPTRLSYSANDPSAVVAIPPTGSDPARRRVVLRQGDGLANPYLAFSAMLLAGLDGLRRQIDPGPPRDRPPEGESTDGSDRIDVLPGDLTSALDALVRDRDFLLVGGVFSPALLDDWIVLRRREVEELAHHPHPRELSFHPQA